MTKVHIIGDCHVSRIYEHHYPEKTDVDFVFWGRRGVKAFAVDFHHMKETHMDSSGIEQSRGIDHFPMDFAEIEDEGIVWIWIGYVDIRQFLPKYKNADDIAKRLVDHVKSYFKNAKVSFIEPLPQFYEMLLKYEGISPTYTFEERQQQNTEFLAALEKYAMEAGFGISVRQQEILDLLGVDKLDASMTHDDAPHPVDGLKPEYNKKIYELFEKKAKEAIDSYNF
jgi:hypothetical protein